MAKAATKDYPQTAREIIAGIGGRENVQSVSHCVTRVRFVLKDEGKADDGAVEKAEGVMKVIHAGGQYQVVIGADVNNRLVAKPQKCTRHAQAYEVRH